MKHSRFFRSCLLVWLLLMAGSAYAQQNVVKILAIGNSFSQDAVLHPDRITEL